MKNQQPPLPRPWHQMALCGVATAAALGLLGLSAGAAAAPTTPGSASLALASSAQTSAASVGVPRALPAASTTLTQHVTDELGILDAAKAQQAGGQVLLQGRRHAVLGTVAPAALEERLA